MSEFEQALKKLVEDPNYSIADSVFSKRSLPEDRPKTCHER
jgi:hypothetical protein